MSSSTAPAWYRRGMNLAEVEGELAKAEKEDVVEAVQDADDADVGEKKALVPRSVQLFFLSFQDRMKKSKGVSATEAWRVACDSASKKKKVTDMPITLPIFREYVLKKLEPVTVDRLGCYKLLVGIGRRQAKLRVSDKKQFTAAQKQELNDAHRRRI
eukprot:1559475-Amphidinium_carterae.1